MAGDKARIDRGGGQAVAETGIVEEALERLRYQRNYLAAAEAGLTKLVAEDSARGGSILLKKPARLTGGGTKDDV